MAKNTFVIIPTYNEKENIQKLIEEIFSLEIKNLQILIIDDNSPDKTWNIIEKLKCKYPLLYLIRREKKLGLGSAYIAGFEFALNKKADLIF